MKLNGIKRYVAYDPATREFMIAGAALQDVQSVRPRIIVDYKAERWHRQGMYPLTRCDWRTGLPPASAFSIIPAEEEA